MLHNSDYFLDSLNSAEPLNAIHELAILNFIALNKNNPDVFNESFSAGKSILRLAAENGHVKIVDALLHVKNLNVHLSDAAGDTAFTVAAANNRKKVVNLFIPVIKSSQDADKKFGDALTKTMTVYSGDSGVIMGHKPNYLLIAASILLRMKTEDLTTATLSRFKRIKNELYDALVIIMEGERPVLNLIFDEKLNSTLRRVFYYEHSVTTKGRLKEFHDRFATLQKSKLEDNFQTLSTSSRIDNALYGKKYDKVIKLLATSKPQHLTPQTLEKLKQDKNKLHDAILKLEKKDRLHHYKMIFEENDKKALAVAFRHGNTNLYQGNLAYVHTCYRVQITEELIVIMLAGKEALSDDEKKMIFEFLSGDGAFKIEDALIKTVLWKWVNQVDQTRLTDPVIQYLKTHCKEIFDHMVSEKNDEKSRGLFKRIFDNRDVKQAIVSVKPNSIFEQPFDAVIELKNKILTAFSLVEKATSNDNQRNPTNPGA